MQFGAYLADPNPLGGQLVPGVKKRNMVPIMGVYTNLITLKTQNKTGTICGKADEVAW